MKKTSFLIAFFVVLASVCTGPEAGTFYGGTLVWGTYTKPTIINPILTQQSVSVALESLIFNNLIRWNEKGELEPDLAASWDISEDGLVYTFRLRKGVRFHDGVECTSGDVKFTFDSMRDPSINSPFRDYFQMVKEFRAPDKYTFEVLLRKPSPSLIFRMVRPIAPRHILEQEGIEKSLFNRAPVGTGPFRFVKWEDNDQITLAYNQDYYAGRPYLDSVVVKTYPDASSLWSALMRDEVDLTLFIESDNYEILKRDRSFNTFAVKDEIFYAISYNLKDEILCDRNVRQAIALAIDRKHMINVVAKGYGTECLGPFPSGLCGFNPDVKPYPFDPDLALDLLRKSGWSDTDKDGIMEKGGRKCEIGLLVTNKNDDLMKIAMLIKQFLYHVGIRVKIFDYEDETRLTPAFLKHNGIQAHLRAFWGDVDPDQAEEHWASGARLGPDKLWEYKNDDVDRYFELGKTITDKGKKEWVYREIHRILYQD